MAACASCGAPLPEGARFCPACGAAVATPAPEEMLKLATVLFADVVSSTARAERLHPEDVRAVMADFFAAMSEEIRAEGGTIEKYVGDAIMAVFGVPAAHEDDPVRAVRAGRRMLARLERWNAARDDPVAVRIGIDTGRVLASPGSDLSVTGDAVNVAARLEQAAQPGEILVGERTARLARGTFELEPLDPLTLKGKADGVPAWRVGAARSHPQERGVPGLRSPLVGREEELAVLQSAFARVRAEGSPQLVTILADAGVGKSRLVREFVAGLDVEAKVVVGRCLPYGDAVTLWPLAEILKSEALVLENDPPHEARAKIGTLVREAVPARLAPEPDRLADALASTLGLAGGVDDPGQAYRAFLAGWRAFLSALAGAQTLVVVVEDLHWADETMLDVLDDLAERVEGAALFLCTSRPDLLRTRPGWGGGRRNFASLPLDPLTLEESGELAGRLLDVDGLPEALRRRILERAEGNPFFLEEILRRLIDERTIVHEGGRWRGAAGIEDVEIPDTVEAVILSRIDLLEAGERRTVQRAAVVGRTFWRGALAALAGEDGVDDVLRTLVRRELVVERLGSSVGGDAEYAFKHVLTRDVAYGSLPRAERAAAHVSVAGWIEQVSGDRTPEFAEFLAHHYDRAWTLSGDDGARGRAVDAYLTAAVRAAWRFALRQADRFGERAVACSAAGPERAATLEQLGLRLYEATNQGERAWHAYTRAIEEAGTDSPAFPRLAAAAAIVATRWHGTLHEHPPAEVLRALIERGLAAAGADTHERVLLLGSRAFMQAMGYEPLTAAGERAAHEAVDIAERLGDPQTLSVALDAVTAVLQAGGRYGDLVAVERRRIELVRHLSDRVEIGDAYAMAAWTAVYMGRFRAGLAYAQTGVDEMRDGANPGLFGHCLSWLAYARFQCGDWDGALDALAELEPTTREDPRGLPPGPILRAYAVCALARELRGEAEEADRLLALVVRFLATDPRPGLVGGVGYAARMLAHRGRAEEARRLFPTDFPRADGTCVLLEAFCEVAGGESDWASARELVPRARDEAAYADLLALPLFADRLEGRMLAAEGDARAAARLLRRSADGFAELGAPWEEAWSRLLLAEATGDGREAARAVPTFERLRSVAELARARRLVASSATS